MRHKAPLLYRTAAVLILTLALGHYFGFRTSDPAWHASPLLFAMQSFRFQTQYFSRSYWDFYSGFGFLASLLLAFAAVVTWQISIAPRPLIRVLRLQSWTLALCFTVATLLSWSYFFLGPLVLCGLITTCLIAAACLS